MTALKRAIVVVVALGTSLAFPLARAATPGVTGLWVAQDGKGAVDIEPCGEKLCGRITWLRDPLNADGKPKRDIHNAQTSLQSRPICGLPILSNFHQDGPDAWTGGQIYDPEKGEDYNCNLHLQADGTLRVRGYLGISLFGRTQIWTRPTARLAACK